MIFRHHAPTDPASGVAAFWNGRYAEHLLRQGAPVPAWAWLNALAHGSTLLVASLATAAPMSDDLPEELYPWARTRKALALAVMGLVSREGVCLRELQLQVLMGVELELAATDGLFRRGPIEAACLVTDVLGAYCQQLRGDC